MRIDIKGPVVMKLCINCKWCVATEKLRPINPFTVVGVRKSVVDHICMHPKTKNIVTDFVFGKRGARVSCNEFRNNVFICLDGSGQYTYVTCGKNGYYFNSREGE